MPLQEGSQQHPRHRETHTLPLHRAQSGVPCLIIALAVNTTGMQAPGAGAGAPAGGQPAAPQAQSGGPNAPAFDMFAPQVNFRVAARLPCVSVAWQPVSHNLSLMWSCACVLHVPIALHVTDCCIPVKM